MEHVCIVCGHIQDETVEGKWEQVPEDHVCPECGCGKEDYEFVIFETLDVCVNLIFSYDDMGRQKSNQLLDCHTILLLKL